MDSEQRANRARQLSDDPIFREVMDGLRQEAINVWSRSKSDAQPQREFSWMMVRVIDRIEDGLQAIIDDAHISNAALVRVPE
jgi:hypothetical protein